jgi:hypothetical protein
MDTVKQKIWDAVNNNDIKNLRSVIHPDIDINFVDEDGKTPLWIAAESGYLEIVKELLKVKTIDIEIAPKSPAIYKGMTPLDIAIERAMWGRTPRAHELIANVIAAKERAFQRRRQIESLSNSFGNLSVEQKDSISTRSRGELEIAMKGLSIRRDRSRSRDRGGKKITRKRSRKSRRVTQRSRYS